MNDNLVPPRHAVDRARTWIPPPGVTTSSDRTLIPASCSWRRPPRLAESSRSGSLPSVVPFSSRQIEMGTRALVTPILYSTPPNPLILGIDLGSINPEIKELIAVE
jgi:hypothetical protein